MITDEKHTKAAFESAFIDFDELSQAISTFLDEQKAEDIVTIDLRSKSSFADGMIIASGRSQRHLKAVAEKLKQLLHELGVREVRLEGITNCDWVLIDAGIVVIHLFRPEIRDFYNLEKMWTKESTVLTH